MFKVTIAQNDPKYTYARDKIEAHFEELTEAWTFVAIAMKHCERVSVIVETVEPEPEEEEAKQEEKEEEKESEE